MASIIRIRVRDSYITDYYTISELCPLAQAAQQILPSGATVVASANPSTGAIPWEAEDGSMHKLVPATEAERLAVAKYMDQVDNLQLGQSYPRRHVFYYRAN